MSEKSRIGRAYQKLYEFLAGRHPNQRIWHFQWSAVSGLHLELKRLAPTLTGTILDVGCGDKPYVAWFTNATHYIGIDVSDSTKADTVIAPTGRWPFDDETFDNIVCFEVLEHVKSLDKTLDEMQRVLKTGGRIIVSVPFLYNVHGAPDDFRRFTHYSANCMFGEEGVMKLEKCWRLGGIGSTLSLLTLNWIESATNYNRLSRLSKGVLLPVWLIVSFLLNILFKVLDYLDRTNAFYGHVLMVFNKGLENKAAL